LARILIIGLFASLGYWVIQGSAGKSLFAADLTQEWPNTDFSKRTVELEEIISGGPPKDGIPAIDQPEFVTPQGADPWLHAQEPVIVVEYQGDARAYPLQILIWHEIVNDVVGDRPVSVTFCPLCNASIVFDRRHRGRILDFGTTGRLRKSDLVMYDRQTETWWQQFSGAAIIGEFAGDRLTQLPARIVAYEDFRKAHPDGRVLSRDTGYSRRYGNNPYRGYDRIDNSPFLLDKPHDPRLPPMERVLAVSGADSYRLYPLRSIKQTPVINDRLGDRDLVVLSKLGTLSVLDADKIADSRKIASANAYRRNIGNRLLDFEYRDGRFLDQQTGSTWNLLGEAVAGPLKGERLSQIDSGVHFAFAWLAFNPDSEIYRAP
jgi:hypothetical protein